MTPAPGKTSKVASSWDAYWHGTGDTGAYSSGGVTHPAILAFWDEFFNGVKRDYPAPRIIDIASGNGAVVERALAVFGDEPLEMSCVDVSEAAIANIRTRFPGVNGILADAREIELADGGFEALTSQFGVEYAGVEAIFQCTRLLTGGGRLALIMHNESGAIQQECRDSLDAVVKLQQSRFVELATELFRAGFAAVRGADRAPYENAARELAPAIAEAESIMEQYGQDVAGDTIARLYSDVARIHEEITQYEADEVLAWLERMKDELVAYAGRMSSMIDSAVDSPDFEQICARLGAGGFDIERAAPLQAPDTDLPLAWVLVAAKA